MVEDIFLDRVVVDLHVVVNSFFVRQMEVVLLVIRGSHAVAGYILFFGLLNFFCCSIEIC
jgi:hypothetical protein